MRYEGKPVAHPHLRNCRRNFFVLEASNLECMRGSRRLFTDLAFRVEAGGSLLVQGANGSGKTSLLRTLAGLTPPATGEVRWNGCRIELLGNEYRRALLYCGHASALKDDLCALDNVMASTALAGRPVALQAAREALRQVGLKGRENLPVRVLSQGQKRRAGLARLLVDDSALWILDEPLTALDAGAVHWLAAVIDRHQARGGMVVLTSHQDVPLAKPAYAMRLGA
jgi:heme exporter protein A